MHATRISGSGDKPLGAPENWDATKHGPCAGLFVRRDIIDGIPFMRSAWELEDWETMMLYAGAKLTLGISGDEHPVVQVGVSEFPDSFEPVLHARRHNAPDGRPMVRVDMLFCHMGLIQRGYAVQQIDGTFADALAMAVTTIEAMARQKGWIE